MGEISSFYFKVLGIHINTNNFPTHTSLTFTNRRPKWQKNKKKSVGLIVGLLFIFREAHEERFYQKGCQFISTKICISVK
jgi:hypothetical protein